MKPFATFSFSRKEIAASVRKPSIRGGQTMKSKKDYNRQKFNKWEN